MPKITIEIDYGNREHLYDYLDEHIELIEEQLEHELETNYTPPEEPPTYKVHKSKRMTEKREVELYLKWLDGWASDIFNLIDEKEIEEPFSIADLLKDFLGEYENNIYLKQRWINKNT